jgi:hypothetical protein
VIFKEHTTRDRAGSRERLGNPLIGSNGVGSLAFVETVKNDLGFKASHRDVIEADVQPVP